MMGAGLLQREHMDILRETQMHIGVLQRMIDQVIEVSAIISGRLELVFDEFDLSTLIARVFDKLKAAIQNRRIEVELFLLSGDHAQIEADKRHIGVVVENLLHNAYSYTLPGGRIQVRMERFPQHVAVTIADTGVGIDADEIDRVFEQMYRGRSADAGPTDARGLGLGLYFAKTIVEAHGGSIELRSEVNAGTQITFSLPLRQPEPLRQPGNSYDLVLGEVVADD
jgi:signal transduction histidine kinase